MNRRDRRDEETQELDERIVDITRVSKVVKGGRTFHFRVVAVVGNNRGEVGVGIGKAPKVPEAIGKATSRARRNMEPVVLEGSTVPHKVIGRCGGARVMLRPATPGTGVIAGGAARAVLEAAGVHDVLTKSLGSATQVNGVQATMDALRQMRSVEAIARERGVPEARVMPFWRRRRTS